VQAAATQQFEKPLHYDVLGVRVDAVGMAETICRVENWIGERSKTRMVAVINVHMVMTAKEDADFANIIAETDLTVPDGMPLVWIGKRKGLAQQRVYGPDLFVEFLKTTEGRGYRHFFYGGRPEMLQEMLQRVRRDFPQTQVVGSYAPPFRPLTAEEDGQIVEMIRAARPDVIWVGIGCPRQERWMYQHRACFDGAVMLAVGQAFDQYAGMTRRAPRWMQRAGLEWFYRLCSEPRRLWRRYLVYNARFAFAMVAAAVGR
jgi:N-acetylglucosaminyldiphosphoundecaprenol N-acetyl-beta-D-mannosaminyltransferase